MLYYVLCFDVWKPLIACPSCIVYQVHVAGGKVQASHDFIGPQNDQVL